MCITLIFENPSVSARALEVDARDAHLGNIDLLIDATGEESLGHWLSRRYADALPMLSVWIEGPGVAVRALMKKPGQSGCYRCLSEHQRAGYLPAAEGGVPHVLAGHGCEGLYVSGGSAISE